MTLDPKTRHALQPTSVILSEFGHTATGALIPGCGS